MTIQKWTVCTSGSTAATGGLADMHAVQHGYSILCLDADHAEVYCLRESGSRGAMPEVDEWTPPGGN